MNSSLSFCFYYPTYTGRKADWTISTDWTSNSWAYEEAAGLFRDNGPRIHWAPIFTLWKTEKKRRKQYKKKREREICHLSYCGTIKVKKGPADLRSRRQRLVELGHRTMAPFPRELKFYISYRIKPEKCQQMLGPPNFEMVPTPL